MLVQHEVAHKVQLSQHNVQLYKYQQHFVAKHSILLAVSVSGKNPQTVVLHLNSSQKRPRGYSNRCGVDYGELIKKYTNNYSPTLVKT